MYTPQLPRLRRLTPTYYWSPVLSDEDRGIILGVYYCPYRCQVLLAVQHWLGPRALGEFGATLLFAGNLLDVTQTMPLAIYMTLESNPQVAVALALVLALSSIGILVLLRLVPNLLNTESPPTHGGLV